MEFKDNVICRPDQNREYDDEPSLGHLIIKKLTQAGDMTMLVDGISGKKLSATELVSKSIDYVKALMAAGVKPGDVVSIVSENRFEFVFIIFGTIFLNCTLAPINHTYSERELEHALNLSKPKTIFVSASTAKKVLIATKSLRFVKKVIFIDNDATPKVGQENFKDILTPQVLSQNAFNPTRVDKSKSICLILCSSGTTGLPKGVQLSQSNFIFAIRHAISFPYKNVNNEEVVMLGLLPLFHVYGAELLITTMATASAMIVMLPRFEEGVFLSSIQKYRCNHLFLVPPLMVFLAKNKIIKNYNLSSVKFIYCGAAPLSKETEQEVRDQIGNSELTIKQTYGMTELSSAVLTQKDVMKPGGVGDVNVGISAKVVDENNRSLGQKERGELCFKGGRVMVGYINNAEATSAMVDKDGWLHTGDVGYYDEDLQFFVVDRIKELIKWKGFQVPPAEIEALLLTHPKIKDCGVIGKPDEAAGELPLAFVVKSDPSLTEFEVMNFVKGKASPAKRLHGGVIFVDEIPKNPSGKILRRQLRESLMKLEIKAKL